MLHFPRLLKHYNYGFEQKCKNHNTVYKKAHTFPQTKNTCSVLTHAKLYTHPFIFHCLQCCNLERLAFRTASGQLAHNHPGSGGNTNSQSWSHSNRNLQ